MFVDKRRDRTLLLCEHPFDTGADKLLQAEYLLKYARAAQSLEDIQISTNVISQQQCAVSLRERGWKIGSWALTPSSKFQL